MKPNEVKEEGVKDFGKGKMPLNTSSKELNGLINKPMTPNEVVKEVLKKQFINDNEFAISLLLSVKEMVGKMKNIYHEDKEELQSVAYSKALDDVYLLLTEEIDKIKK